MRANLLVILCLSVSLPACSRMFSSGSSSLAPSPTFHACDVEQVLSQAGFTVKKMPGERTTNSASGRAQILDHGTVTPMAHEFPCYAIMQAVNKRVLAAADGSHHEGWHPQTPEHAGGPVRFTTFYNEGQRHGELHVWLFPNEDESEIGYALHLTEVPLE